MHSAITHFHVVVLNTGRSRAENPLKNVRILPRSSVALGQVALSTLLSLLKTDLQIQIPFILANKFHVMSQHGQLSDNLSGGRIGEEHNRFGRTDQLVRDYFDGGSFFQGVTERDDFSLVGYGTCVKWFG